ncbi:DUF5333 family protein [Algirhabdus cladophorae]|uniref:DUF5333 family protein n=1 Tax=Algirhabdus cladophorae TaxID=3377108 RepID=UPI003B849758
MRGLGAVLVMLVSSGTAFAQDRPAPDYFLQTLTDLNLAQALATQCQELSIDPAAAQMRTDDVLDQLEADGFDRNDPVSQMADASVALGQLQDAFVTRHSLAGADRTAYCAAGQQDVEAAIGPGQFLVKIVAQN